MKKTITIATAHTKNFKTGIDKRIEITLEGGSPYFGYIWIDDIIFTIVETSKSFKITRTRL